MPEIKRNIAIEPRLEAYSTFFDHEWSRKIDDLTAGTAIEGAVFDLCYIWKSISNSHIAPWLLIHTLKDFCQGIFAAEDNWPAGWKIVQGLRDKLLRKVPDLTVTTQHKIQRAIQEIVDETRVAVENAQAKAFSVDEAWDSMLDPSLAEFRLSIWGTQRLCYTGLYFTYEEFIRHVLAIKMNNPSYRLPKSLEKIEKDVTTYVGQAMVAQCITDPPLCTAREVRNALSHNGGKAGPNLGIQVEDGVLQIQPDHNKALFDLLKVKAYRFAEAAI